MKTLINLLCLIMLCSGCVATHTIVLDRNASWIMTADDVYGSYLIRTNGVWVKQKGKLHYPEAWVCGPPPK